MIDYTFCSDEFLYAMNDQFLGHKSYTDILTFDYTNEETPEQISGEIFISIDRIKDNSARFSVPFEDELYRVIIHGVLHLCGYQDESSADKKRMRLKENDYLILLKKKS